MVEMMATAAAVTVQAEVGTAMEDLAVAQGVAEMALGAKATEDNQTSATRSIRHQTSSVVR